MAERGTLCTIALLVLYRLVRSREKESAAKHEKAEMERKHKEEMAKVERKYKDALDKHKDEMDKADRAHAAHLSKLKEQRAQELASVREAAAAAVAASAAVAAAAEAEEKVVHLEKAAAKESELRNLAVTEAAAAKEALAREMEGMSKKVEALEMALEEARGDTAKLRAELAKEVRVVERTVDFRQELCAFDNRLVSALKDAYIRPLRSAWLLAQPEGFTLPYRQQLEELERNGEEPSPLLTPEEAGKLVEQGNRSLGAVTHGWLCPGNPDPAGRRMRILRRTLMANPYIVAIFFECAQEYSTRFECLSVAASARKI